MASDYHPLYSTLWDDEKLEGTSFECHGFFAYLCSNNRVRPSGIYRVTDQQLAANTLLPVRRVTGYCLDLDRRELIVRDGAWLFVISYFKRQPKGDNLLRGVASDIATCSSIRVLNAFALKYPARSQWVTDRRATLDRPIIQNRSTEQCSAVQCNTEQDSAEALAAGSNGFRIPEAILRSLSRAPVLGSVARLREDVSWWQAEVRARPNLDLDQLVLDAEAWLKTNPKKAAKITDYVRFLHNWFKGEKKKV